MGRCTPMGPQIAQALATPRMEALTESVNKPQMRETTAVLPSMGVLTI